MSQCNGEGVDGDHCCYVDGKRCDHLVENQGGRRFACALRIKYETWDAVNASPEYRPVGEHWAARGLPFNYCERFDPAFCCRPEFRAGRHNENCPPGCADLVRD